MPSSVENYGYNLSLELLKAFQGVSTHLDKETKEKIEELSKLNEINELLQKLLSAFTHAQSDGKADFTQNTEFQANKRRLTDLNPEITHRLFGNHPDKWKNKEEVNGMLSSLDAETKLQVSKVNQVTMNMTQLREDESQFVDITGKVLEMLIRHVDAIINKLRAS